MRRLIMLAVFGVFAVLPFALRSRAASRDQSRVTELRAILKGSEVERDAILAGNGGDTRSDDYLAFIGRTAPQWAEWRELNRRHPEWGGK